LNLSKFSEKICIIISFIPLLNFIISYTSYTVVLLIVLIDTVLKSLYK
jgi:hypothetical protein